MKLSIIIVNYNGGKVLPDCLSSVFRETRDISFEVILVDNASTDGSAEMVEGRFPEIRVIHNSRNIGFAAANNVGIRESRGEHVLLLNPDTEVLNGALQKSVQFIEGNPQVGIVGCKLLFPNLLLQPSVTAFPSMLSSLLHSTFFYLFLSRTTIIERCRLRNIDYSVAQEVDSVMGSFFLIRRTMLASVGVLDEQFFMYGEEVDYCFRAKKGGYQVWYMPDAVVVHYWGGVSSPTLWGVYWLHLSQRLFVRKHVRGLEKYIINALDLFGALVRVPVYFFLGCMLFNKRLIAKSYYVAYAVFRIPTSIGKHQSDSRTVTKTD